MSSLLDIVLRIGFAAAVGIGLGANRWLHHKSAGVKTHALVAIGAAVAVIGVLSTTPETGPTADAAVNAIGRVIQGLLTGIGFLGAGVIIRNASGTRIQGLTTAASIWITTILGALIGMGQLALAAAAVGAIGIVLLFGTRLEHAVGRYFGQRRSAHDGDTTDADSD